MLGEQIEVSVDENLDRLVVTCSGRKMEGGSTEAVAGHEVLGVPGLDASVADER